MFDIDENLLVDIFTFGYEKDINGNLIIEKEEDIDLKIEITTPYVETKLVDDFINDESEYGEIDNI